MIEPNKFRQFSESLIKALADTKPSDQWDLLLPTKPDHDSNILYSKPFDLPVMLQQDTHNRGRYSFRPLLAKEIPFWFEDDVPSCTFNPAKEPRLIIRDLYRKIVRPVEQLRIDWAIQAGQVVDRDREAHELAKSIADNIPAGKVLPDDGKLIPVAGVIGGRHTGLYVERLTGRVRFPEMTVKPEKVLDLIRAFEV